MDEPINYYAMTTEELESITEFLEESIRQRRHANGIAEARIDAEIDTRFRLLQIIKKRKAGSDANL